MQYSDYVILIRGADGIKREVIDNYIWLDYTNKVNEPGLLQFQVEGNNPKISALEIDGQIEIKRRNPAVGLDWYTDFIGLVRGERRYTTEQGIDLYTVTVAGVMSLLSRRIVAYSPDKNMRATYTNQKAETVMKNLVKYNITSLGTTLDGRKANAALGGFTIDVQSDSAQGNTISWSAAWGNLLTELQKVANVSGGDFNLVRTDDTTFEFRFYLNQLGTDRTASIVFSMENANLAAPDYEISRITEKTIGIVAGQGEDSERDVVVVTGNDYSATNDIEVFIDARTITKGNTSALTSLGNSKLYDYRAQEMFDFKVLQSESTFYGVDYFLGDLVTAKYKDITTTQKIDRINIRYEKGNELEHIDIGLLTVG